MQIASMHFKERAHANMANAELQRNLQKIKGKFVAKRGPGLHHVAYAVEDIERALKQAREAGAELIDAEPRPGMHGGRIAFLHPKSVGGVLTELVEA